MRRTVDRVLRGRRQVDGAGVHLLRVFGRDEAVLMDPFLMLDFFDSDRPEEYEKGFPWHPHRGIDTITCLFEGALDHADSLGNAGVIEGDGCQWMTAGGGLLHQEMPRRSPRMLGLQLWANLPPALKMTAPRYRDLPASSIPSVSLSDGGRVRILAGEFDGVTGPVERDDIAIRFLDVRLPGGTALETPVAPDHTAFLLSVRGSLSLGENHEMPEGTRPGDVLLLSPGDELQVRAWGPGAHFLLVSGRPIGAPIAWGGPIVMNTRAELDLAFRQLREGTFVHPGPFQGT